ncbi:hypothetical protein ACSBL2_15020 [Pedobacter sp. AW31-3R]|uniref:hypothetical protein n=1 Tax=Pedobacter sp. AW31-3R TaxID=3445781 RepID=UPI003F9F051B
MDIKLFEDNIKWIDDTASADCLNKLTLQMKQTMLCQEGSNNDSNGDWVSIAESSAYMVLTKTTSEVITFMN